MEIIWNSNFKCLWHEWCFVGRYLLMHCLWLLHATAVVTKTKPKILIIWPFTKKKKIHPTSVLICHWPPHNSVSPSQKNALCKLVVLNWRYFLIVTNGRRGLLLASYSEQRPGMLMNILQWSGQAPSSPKQRLSPAQSVEVEKPW